MELIHVNCLLKVYKLRELSSMLLDMREHYYSRAKTGQAGATSIESLLYHLCMMYKFIASSCKADYSKLLMMSCHQSFTRLLFAPFHLFTVLAARLLESVNLH